MKRISPDMVRFLMLFFASMIGFFVLSFYSNLAYDDFNYKFMYDQFGLTSHRVVSISDIFVSQYHHYFVFAGRVIVHFFVQLFLIPDNKIWFDLANSIIFGCFLLLILRNSSTKKMAQSSSIFLALIIFLWYLVSGQNYCMLWLSGSVNYMWSVSASLLLLLMNRRLLNNYDKKTTKLIVVFVAAFLLNSLHEVISISISCALMLELLVFRNFRNKSLIVLNLGALVGALFVGLAPSNFIRMAIVSSTSHNDLQTVVAADDSHLFIIINAIKIFLVLGLLLLIIYFKSKDIFRNLIRRNFVFFVAIFVSFLFVYVVKGFNQRAIFPAVIYALVILLSIVSQYEFVLDKRGVKIVLLLISIPIVFEYSTVVSELKANKMAFTTFDTTLRKSSGNETLFQLPPLFKNRFVCYTGLGGIDRYCVPNMGISRLYSKPFIVLLPRCNFVSLLHISNLPYPIFNKGYTVIFPRQHTAFIQLPRNLLSFSTINSSVILKFKDDTTTIKRELNYGTLNSRTFVFVSIPKDFRCTKIQQVILVKNTTPIRPNNPYN